MNPTEPNRPPQLQPTPRSTDPTPPTTAGACGRHRRIIGSSANAAPLTLLLVGLVGLSSCTAVATSASGPSPSASTPTVNPITTTIALATPPVRTLRPSVHEVAQTTTLNGGNTGPATATCPQGELALGGGWSVPAQGARVFAASLNSDTWAVSVLPLGHPATTSVTAYVECLRGAAGAVVTRRATTIQVGATPPATLNTQLGGFSGFCGQGEVLVGSGFDLGAANANLELEGNWPRDDAFPGTQWVFSVRNNDIVAHSFTFFVECLSNVNVALSYPRQDGNPAYASTTGSAVVSCPSGTVVGGGGFKYTRNSPGNQQVGNLNLLHASANGWQGDVYVVSGYGLYYVTSFAVAVCLSFA
jgi:hypothetical protein